MKNYEYGMHLRKAAKQIMEQLEFAINSMSDADYSTKLEVLNGSSIGQHVRHILEFFGCLNQGYFNGIVNYDKRRRDFLLESDRITAISWIAKNSEQLRYHRLEKVLSLELSYDINGLEAVSLETNYQRELVYNIEHAVHHMAMIRIGLKEVNSFLVLPENFGVAASTIRKKDLAED